MKFRRPHVLPGVRVRVALVNQVVEEGLAELKRLEGKR